MEVDPVCGKVVDEKETPYRIETRGRVYYFCSKTCLDTFIQPEKEFRILKYLTLMAIVCTSIILLFQFAPQGPYPKGIFMLILASIVQFICGFPFFENMIFGLRKKKIDLNFAIILTSLILWIYSLSSLFKGGNLFFHSSSLIITLLLLENIIEKIGRKRVEGEIGKLEKMIPYFALVRKKEEEIVPSLEVKKGDLVFVKTGERVPVDGVVVEGYGNVLNPFSRTLEKKKEGDEVFAGNLLKSGSLLVKAKEEGKNAFLRKCISLLKSSASFKPRIQDQFQKVAKLIKVSLLLLSLSLLVWNLSTGSLERGLVVFSSIFLLSFTPAFTLLPLATMLLPSTLFKKGIIVKQKGSLEELDRVSCIAFGKEMILREPSKIEEIIPMEEGEEEKVLMIAAIAARGVASDIRHKILKKAEEMNIKVPRAEEYEIFEDGIKATYLGRKILLGSQKMMERGGVKIGELPEELKGRRKIFVAYGKKLMGVIILEERIEEKVRSVIEKLKKFANVVLISEENEEETMRIAEKLGIERYFPKISPERRGERIKELQKEGKLVMYVGNGEKDISAIRSADISVVTNAKEIEVEADIILLQKDLEKIMDLFELCNKGQKKMRENFLLSLFFTVIPVILSISSLPTLGPEIAGVSILANSFFIMKNSI